MHVSAEHVLRVLVHQVRALHVVEGFLWTIPSMWTLVLNFASLAFLHGRISLAGVETNPQVGGLDTEIERLECLWTCAAKLVDQILEEVVQ